MANVAALFRTVAIRDYLGFWANNRLDARAVVRFLELDKRDVAKVAKVALTSVRFDEKMPTAIVDRLEEIANTCALVAQFFDGDVVKTALWFKTKNPLFGDVAPREMIREGRYETVRQFVVEATEATMTLAHDKEHTDGIMPAIIERRRGDIAQLCELYGVRELALFGSILRSDFDPASSDVDAAVKFGPPTSHSLARQYFDFKQALERLLSRPVDLVELEVMPDTRLKRIIEHTKVPIYAAAA
jgi:predicted nucleotidyltransferase